MKIISKFQDYYDIGIAYGIDEKLRFERKRKVIEEYQRYSTHVSYIYYHKHRYYRLMLFAGHVGFCGKKYPYIRTVIEKISKQGKETSFHLHEETYHYTLEDYGVWMHDMFGEGKEFILGTYAYCGYEEKRRQIKIADFIKDAKEFYEDKEFKTKMLFETHQIPYFAVESEYIIDDKKPQIVYRTILTPQLKKYRFVQVMPPMQAFQEISMYLGKLGLGEDNTVTIEDKYLAQGKGFDCYSFRNMPSKRKAKSC